jgi:nucleotide-binding universal stress UspA family protein
MTRTAEAYLCRQIQRMGEMTGASIEVRVVRFGSVAECLLGAVQPGDLVVMASRRQHLWPVHLGHVTATMVRRAPVPVVLVPATAGGMASALGGAMARDATGQ